MILAIDNGTQSVRALLFDDRGDMRACEQINIEPWFAQKPGWAEQHPEYYWEKVGEACRGLWRDGHKPESVAGIAVTTQRATQICLDADGKPVRPAITWVDERRTDILPPMPWYWRLAVALIGKGAALDHARHEAECNWVAAHEPDNWAKTARFVQLSGYLNFQLTGNYRDSVASQVGYIPFDYKAQRWASPASWRWHAFAVRRHQLPELVDPGQSIGDLLPSAAEHLGLKSGVPVIAAGADKACELIGSGLIDEHIACLSYGTRATINVNSRHYFEATGTMPAYPSVMPHSYNVEAAVPRGFWMVSWFKREFGHEERHRAEEEGVAPEKLLDELVRTVPPGSEGLILQPYWGRDVAPGLEARGAIIGFSDTHTRAHLYRSILEGLAYALREGKECIEQRGSHAIEKLRVSGGGSQSDAALQITADVFGLPVERPHTYETSGLGAAIIAAVGLGWFSSIQQAMEQMTRQGDVFMPNAEAQAMYESLYKNVYGKLYSRLAPLYSSIRRVVFPSD
ncbi:carbohydrate kinase, fggy [gamma proteobacterium HTCC5015]|nr:carbohydrate kinase, fggy [gamma proteobacterium HTCC5015]